MIYKGGQRLAPWGYRDGKYQRLTNERYERFEYDTNFEKVKEFFEIVPWDNISLGYDDWSSTRSSEEVETIRKLNLSDEEIVDILRITFRSGSFESYSQFSESFSSGRQQILNTLYTICDKLSREVAVEFFKHKFNNFEDRIHTVDIFVDGFDGYYDTEAEVEYGGIIDYSENSIIEILKNFYDMLDKSSGLLDDDILVALDNICDRDCLGPERFIKYFMDNRSLFLGIDFSKFGIDFSKPPYNSFAVGVYARKLGDCSYNFEHDLGDCEKIVKDKSDCCKSPSDGITIEYDNVNIGSDEDGTTIDYETPTLENEDCIDCDSCDNCFNFDPTILFEYFDTMTEDEIIDFYKSIDYYDAIVVNKVMLKYPKCPGPVIDLIIDAFMNVKEESLVDYYMPALFNISKNENVAFSKKQQVIDRIKVILAHRVRKNALIRNNTYFKNVSSWLFF